MDECVEALVVYALPGEQRICPVRLPGGATVRDAVQASGLLAVYRELQIDALSVGVFGQMTTIDAPLRSGDRVEIYRALTADPKETRRRRAARRARVKR